VIYVGCFIVVALVSIGVIYNENKPRQVVDISQGSIECSNGKVYTPTDLRINPNDTALRQDFDWFRITTDVSKMKRLCVAGTLDGSVPLNFDQLAQFNSPEEDVYKIIEQNRIEGSWKNVAIFSIGAVVLIVAFFWTIEKVFHYVYSGALPLRRRSR